jgi:dipeptidyl aminopeptidase/acylaminoacyl peptidase
VREVIGVKDAQEALFALPDGGRLLVVSDEGAWVVRSDGSRRLLGPYREASWSPTGKYVVGTGRNLLVALEPDGGTRWKLARRNVRLPRWGGTEVDTRIAYLSGRQLRVIAGDGTGDRRLVRRVDSVAPAWRPGSAHVLAFVGVGGRLVVAEADSGRRLWSRRLGTIEKLEWSSDGRRLLVQARRFLRVFSPGGQLRYDLLGRGAAPIADASFGPEGRSVAFVQRAAGRSDLWVIARLRPDASAARRVFVGKGVFTDVSWSPDGKWVLIGWEDANQWVFLPNARVRNVQAVNSVSEQFGRGFPSPVGWCCP